MGSGYRPSPTKIVIYEGQKCYMQWDYFQDGTVRGLDLLSVENGLHVLRVDVDIYMSTGEFVEYVPYRIPDEPVGRTGAIPSGSILIDVNYAKKEWYPHDFEATTSQYGYACYETNKIKKVYTNILQSEGYPVGFCKKIDYTSMVGLTVYEWEAVNPWKTMQLWRDEPSSRWREVYIGWIIDPNSEIGTLERLLPSKYSPYETYIDEAIWQGSQNREMIFPRIAFKQTINTNLIIANWDFIVGEL